MSAVLECQAVAECADPYVLTPERVAAAQVVLDNMTPAELAAIHASNAARAQREETRRQDFALHLQIKANPQHWI